jgi:spore germination protein GerM
MQQVQSTRIASLFFIQVDDDGAISRHEVKRTVSSSEFPLTDALNALLAGPSADELSRNFITLIPSGTRLLSAQVRGSTAYVDFSEAFMYNRYGIEGYAGQLKQVVYTATSFPTVKDVQILIEGSRRKFLGGEGVYIGKPLSRASF